MPDIPITDTTTLTQIQKAFEGAKDTKHLRADETGTRLYTHSSWKKSGLGQAAAQRRAEKHQRGVEFLKAAINREFGPGVAEKVFTNLNLENAQVSVSDLKRMQQDSVITPAQQEVVSERLDSGDWEGAAPLLRHMKSEQRQAIFEKYLDQWSKEGEGGSQKAIGLGKALMQDETDHTMSAGEFMRAQNPASEFNRAFLDKFAEGLVGDIARDIKGRIEDAAGDHEFLSGEVWPKGDLKPHQKAAQEAFAEPVFDAILAGVGKVPASVKEFLKQVKSVCSEGANVQKLGDQGNTMLGDLLLLRGVFPKAAAMVKGGPQRHGFSRVMSFCSSVVRGGAPDPEAYSLPDDAGSKLADFLRQISSE